MSNNINCKPFLRWAGGKRWLLKELKNYLPTNGFNQYHEPFLGGGAIYFHLQPKQSYLSDLNEELIECYSSIKEEVDEVIQHLKTFKNTKEDYYKIRKQNFKSSAKRSAKFIYLNKASFNGIYRVNQKGEYNVPYGYRKTLSYDYDNLKKISQVLTNTNIYPSDFYNIVDNVKKNDLVFLDPPYTVTHNNNGFFQYNKNLFSLESQYKLAKMIHELKEIGAYYILTNAAHPDVKEIFNNGDPVFEVSRTSIIGGKCAKRGQYNEIIITNGVR